MLRFDYNATYEQTIIELKNRIENDYGSMKSFCDKNDIDRPNMVRVFSRSNDKDMSVGLYIRCCIVLGLMPEGSIDTRDEDAQLFNLSLRNYLKIDQTAVWRSMMALANPV